MFGSQSDTRIFARHTVDWTALGVFFFRLEAESLRKVECGAFFSPANLCNFLYDVRLQRKSVSAGTPRTPPSVARRLGFDRRNSSRSLPCSVYRNSQALDCAWKSFMVSCCALVASRMPLTRRGKMSQCGPGTICRASALILCSKHHVETADTGP